MMILSLKSLVAKFNDAMRSATEAAAGLCVARTHYEVEIEHVLLKALEADGTDLSLIVEHYGVNRARLTAELNASLDRLKAGNSRGPSFSTVLVDVFSASWTVATLNYDATQIRTGFILLALLAEESHARLLREISREIQKVPLENLRQNFYTTTASSSESVGLTSTTQEESSDVSGPTPGAHTPFLDQYTADLTKNAREGRVDMVIGRDQEIRQMIDVLMRRRQNNPILTGEAGVGKTAVVEGLAIRITEGDVPPALRNVRLHTLDLALLQAGASVKGEFENRLNGVIKEVKSSPQPVILFIDEAHTIIGAGGLPGQGDAANILKPVLARGELRTIAATTWSEYKRFFEKDAALARRFQVVKVDEPSELQCEAMLRGILASLEKHHGVRITEDAITAAVRLSHRYMAGRQLPDKAVSVLDTACARVALSMSASPSAIEEVRRRIVITETQKRVLVREQATGSHHGERLIEIDLALEDSTRRLAELQHQWEQENRFVERIHLLRAKLEAESHVSTDRSADLEELTRVQHELKLVQRENALALVLVDAQIVGAVVSEWTGVPLGKMLNDELAMILTLDAGLKKRVIGQDHAMTAIAQRVQTSRANLDDPRKPIGVFMLVGPSGVGKTETALALTDMLYGGEHTLITINMSEFQEPHSVSTLKGAPPGYVGYGEGGVLTEAVRRQPYSVVLLDEVEKAHPDVLELFFQVFDKGSMEDGEGRWIDFRNTLILLTTNAASDLIMKLAADPETMPLPGAMVAAIKPELNRIFKPAFLGRTLVVPYYPVRDEVLKQIIRLKLGRIQQRMQENHKVALLYDDALLELVAQRCVEVESGARNVDHLLSNTLLPEISRQMLAKMAEDEPMESVSVGVSNEGECTYKWKSSNSINELQTVLQST
jgi:type VI secretion system protein VasG